MLHGLKGHTPQQISPRKERASRWIYTTNVDQFVKSKNFLRLFFTIFIKRNNLLIITFFEDILSVV